jgi:hypothetical protein
MKLQTRDITTIVASTGGIEALHIDFANGGDIRGLIRAVDAYLKCQTIIPKSCPAMARSPKRPIWLRGIKCW